MLCSLSGTVPEEPVISLKSGHLYEKRLIEKHIETTGRDPVTREEVTVADLLPVKSSLVPKPRPVALGTIPGLLSALGSEWDALMLETFQLRQTLEQTRQELSQALYQHDAACRVIARVIKERDQARSALSAAQGALASRPAAGESGAASGGGASGGGGDESAAAAGVSEALLAAIKDKGKDLSSSRKERRKRSGALTAAPAVVASLALRDTFTPHSPSAPGISALGAVSPASACAELAARSHMVLTGGVDRAVLLFDAAKGAVAARIEGATSRGAVSAVAFHASRDVLYSAGGDGAVRVWANVSAPPPVHALAGGGTYRAAHALRPHSRDIVGMAPHPLSDVLVAWARDGAWSLSDAAAGRVLAVVADEAAGGGGGFTSGALHPDGILFIAGCGDGAVRIFDLREMRRVAEVLASAAAAAVASLAISENGYTMASGAADGCVRLWDLRKVAAVRALLHARPAAPATEAEAAAAAGAGGGVAVSALAFEDSGSFLASGAADGSIVTWHAKEDYAPLHRAPLRDCSAAISGLAWVDHARTLYATSLDRTLRVYAAPAL